MEAGRLIAWMKKPGDRIERGEIIAEIDTDKGLIEVECFATGVVEKLLINPGDGVETVFGVIYPPQVAIVGFGKVVERPWAVHGMIGARQVMTATLAADHRASDGHRGGRFLAEVDRLLQEPEKL
jgi:pyruvate/2-oxoglutarate dehydrogenase complex dihydrolipoamide acyltransferase (E2) component